MKYYLGPNVEDKQEVLYTFANHMIDKCDEAILNQTNIMGQLFSELDRKLFDSINLTLKIMLARHLYRLSKNEILPKRA